MLHKFLKLFFLCFQLVFIFSCSTKVDSPESTLERYINKRFSENVSRQEILDFTSGTLFLQISELNDEQFAQFSKMELINKTKLKILHKKCRKEKCYLTYYFSYNDKRQGPNLPTEVEVKKIAEMDFEDGKWKISSISNLKTFINSANPIEL